MAGNERKLRAALAEMKSSGAKINPSAVEKKAGVANGSLKYYEELHEEVVELKNSGDGNELSDKDKRLKSLKKTKNKAMKSKRDAESELSELKAAVKKERQEHVDTIANLTWALHKAQHNRVLTEINSAHNIAKLEKS